MTPDCLRHSPSTPPPSSTDTLRAYLERTKQGKFDEAEMARLAAEKERRQQLEQEKAAGINVGDRCEVARPAQLPTRGTVRFCGKSGGGGGGGGRGRET